MHVHEAAIHVCTRASPVGLAWRVDLQEQEGILGEALERASHHPSLPFSPSFSLLSCGEWTEEIRAWGLGVVGACAVSVATRASFLGPSPSPLFLRR